MTDAYGTSRSIFSDAIFFTTLLAAKTCEMEYNYAVEKDWNTASGPREVTYGKEVKASLQYPGGEMRYYTVGDATGNFTNPISNSNASFDFSHGFLPYVANYEDKDKNTTYPVVEIKVNYKAPGLTVGCGTYNDPYIITSAEQFNTVAEVINGTSYPSKICLPNTFNADHISVSWHDATKGCGNYEKSGSNYNKVADNTNGLGNGTWTQNRVRYYLASAYYKIDGNFTLSSDFDGLGKPNGSSNTKGNTVFHGVIVGDSNSKPTITIPNGNPLIVVANGAVIKGVNINVTGNITREQNATGDMALYGYGIQTMKDNKVVADEKAQYYGGVIGEIMGGDNIIDDVTVTYSGSTTLSGTYAHVIAEGGMVGAVVNGALIFRGSNTVSGRSVYGGGIYSNPYVGRVINGYAIYEQIDKRAGTAPDNGNNYHIDTIVRKDTNKLDVNYADGTVSVPDAQALYIMSLITQSIAGTAATTNNNDYEAYSPSYGYKDYLNGVARLGDYNDVGCGSDKVKADYADYNSYAYLDSVNNHTDNSNPGGLMWAPIPYIIYKYTERHGTTADKPALDFPARKMTSDDSKFWTIILSNGSDFNTFDSYKAFRGIGSIGIRNKRVSMKIKEFNGNNNTIALDMKMVRYTRDQENYFHAWNTKVTQDHSKTWTAYGIDTNIEALLGFGLFDMTLTENANSIYKDFTLKGKILDVCYDKNGNDVTGKSLQSVSSTSYSISKENAVQLFAVGGVVGQGWQNYYQNFESVYFNGLEISGNYVCGGLIGLDSDCSGKTITIKKCNSIGKGISVTGGYFGTSNDPRIGIGSLVGMSIGCPVFIDGADETSGTNKADMYISKVTTHYTPEDNRCVVGGLIGYTGMGATVKNVNIVALGDNAAIGADNVAITGGILGFTQRKNNSYSPLIFENCSINNISIKARRCAGGLFGRTWFNGWGVHNIAVKDCYVKGNGTTSIISASGTGTDDAVDIVGGLFGLINTTSDNRNNGTPYDTQSIDNCYVTGYTLKGNNVGGLVGHTRYKGDDGGTNGSSDKTMVIRDSYVADCTIQAKKYAGGLIGENRIYVSGYNISTINVSFQNWSGTAITDNDNTGAFIGHNFDGNRTFKLIGIGTYGNTVPSKLIGSDDPKNDSFIVYADYMNTSSADITNKSGYASTFGNANNVDQPLAPYVNVNPHMSMGSSEFLTGDGASLGKAGQIYKEVKEANSNRKYTIGTTNDTSTNTTDAVTLAKYINDNGTYKAGAFKISTANAEFGTLPDGVQNFAMLVINDDSAKASDITPFIKAYIRLATNAAGSANTNSNTRWYHRDAYSCGNNNINGLYEVVINPCYYDEESGKFVLGTAGAQGLQMYSSGSTDHGKYYFDSNKADSESDNPYQFSLVDVQFKDPTDSTKIAYHLYVPVYTRKMLSVKFSAVSLTSTPYLRGDYAAKIASEIRQGKTANNPSFLVESTDEWTTTFIRFTYPKNQITDAYNWNFDKSVVLRLDGNFSALPDGTKLVLVDPNANVDKFYTLELDGTIPIGVEYKLDLSRFKDESKVAFSPQNLSAILADGNASNGNELYEDYYISMYVPKVDGQAHGVRFGSGTEMGRTGGDEKANIEFNLWSFVMLGDLFEHTITSFKVDPSNAEITDANNTLTTRVTATVRLKEEKAGPYLRNSDIAHGFYITLTSHDADGRVSDLIFGTSQKYIQNTTTISYTVGQIEKTKEVTHSYLGGNYVEVKSGSIKDALLSDGTPVVTIHSVTTMAFMDINAFPYNPEKKANIGTQVSVKSNLAYRESDLQFSSMKKLKDDPASTFYYVTTRNKAALNFSAVPSDDVADEIGFKTNNRSLLGVNGKYCSVTPILGHSIYDANDIVDYEGSTAIRYTISLYKKVTDNSGTKYVQVSDIGRYLQDVTLTDSEAELTADVSDTSEYVYTGSLSRSNPKDPDKIFEADFSCKVLTGDSGNREYANFKIYMTVELIGSSNTWSDSYIIYTNAKINPTVIDE